MKTQYYTASSLDGFIADERHSLDWLLQFGQATDDYPGYIREVGAVAMGASTYEWLLAHHVRPGTDREQPWPYAQPSWVFTSRELPRPRDADVRLARGDVRPVHEAMTRVANGKNVWIVGGGELAGQFADAGLLDEIILGVAPVTLGTGAPVLPRRITSSRLRSSRVEQRDQFAYLTYELGPPA